VALSAPAVAKAELAKKNLLDSEASFVVVMYFLFEFQSRAMTDLICIKT
jgi:hypothetical protein